MHPPAVVRALLLGTAAVWVILELRQSLHRRPEAAHHDGGSRPVLRVCIVAGVLAGVAARHGVPGATISPAGVWAWVGLALFCGGVGLRVWSFQTLGRYFTFTVQTSRDQPVIRAGPYRVVRHPSYAGMLLALTGIGVLIGNWLSLVCLVGGALGGLVYRITVEERALLRDVGEDYRRYAETHKRLVPWVW